MNELDQAAAPQAVDLVLYAVGEARYASDLTQVLRVDRFDPALSVGEPLGHPQEGRRALAFLQGDQERMLAIDVLHGVRSVPVLDLRKLPRAARAAAHAVGAWLDGDDTILLIDLTRFASP